MVLFAILLLLPSTRSVGLWLLQENHPIELGTAFILFAGCAVSMVRAVKIRKVGGTFIIYGFYIVFGMGLLFVAMEELAWGQWLFGFETPEACKVINRQGETTLHNLAFFQGHSEFTRMTFGLGALAGVWIGLYPKFSKIGVPALLLPWIAIIIVHAGIDAFNDFIPIQPRFDLAINKTSELIELYIASTAFLYPFLNGRIQD
ncbi:MAG: hypothetical protein HKP10_00765 [Kiritimatiellales bacterium]|nr:hypothetical protein [Kiritimatiellales bacterium]